MKNVDCQFRTVEKGRSVCGVAQMRTDRNVDTVDQAACMSCPIPDIIKKRPCVNLNVGTQIIMPQGKPVVVSYAVDCAWRPFAAMTDVDNCDCRCPQWTPVQIGLDLSKIEPLFNSTERSVTDSLLRQAVLVVLYRYHSDHPERYGFFDVTPEYLMRALGVDRGAIARIILPMAESGEIRLKFDHGHTMFSAATITYQGIERLDREPVLGQLNTAAARSLGEPAPPPRVAENGRNGHSSSSTQGTNGKVPHPLPSASGLFKNAAYDRSETKASE